MTARELAKHREHVKKARKLYVESRTPERGAKAWHAALRDARVQVSETIRASAKLSNVAGALQESGRHMAVFRHLMAPPMSQDQFAINCNDWSKATEKNGRPLKAAKATAVAACFQDWRDRTLLPWLEPARDPTMAELRDVTTTVGTLMASQAAATTWRNLLAAEQEHAVVAMLSRNGWTRLPSKLLDDRALLPTKHFMHKTRFATTSRRPQEVDIAFGLKKSVVLAMECKVTNDVTNSVKRVNDVIKKATAWKDQWGNVVKTAAMLQGVIAFKDVERLLDSGVLVFWSHDMETLESWLNTQV